MKSDAQYCHIKNSRGNRIAYCYVTPKEDMGKLEIILVDNDGERSFDKPFEFLKVLREAKLPPAEIRNAISFINKKLRAVRKFGDNARIRLGGIGSEYSQESEI